jgi:hypothetical protein
VFPIASILVRFQSLPLPFIPWFNDHGCTNEESRTYWLLLIDRALQHIAKKGRPVSQCAHCRTLRKSRSAHVKCDCGEKSHGKAACSHLKEGEKGKQRHPCRLTNVSDLP